MVYRAIEYFTDLQDNNYPYNKGDIFPREGFAVDSKRIEYLAGYENKQHRPVIKIVEEKSSKPHKYTAKELNSKTIAQVEDIANEVGYKLTKTLKADIIKEFLEQQ